MTLSRNIFAFSNTFSLCFQTYLSVCFCLKRMDSLGASRCHENNTRTINKHAASRSDRIWAEKKKKKEEFAKKEKDCGRTPSDPVTPWGDGRPPVNTTGVKQWQHRGGFKMAPRCRGDSDAFMSLWFWTPGLHGQGQSSKRKLSKITS